MGSSKGYTEEVVNLSRIASQDLPRNFKLENHVDISAPKQILRHLSNDITRGVN
jgi:hypothetical protein